MSERKPPDGFDWVLLSVMAAIAFAFMTELLGWGWWMDAIH